MNEIKLLPCPFCGGEAKWATEHKHWIICKRCQSESDYYENSDDALKAWNTRKPMEEIVERLEESGFGNDAFLKWVPLDKAIEIVKEVGGM